MNPRRVKAVAAKEFIHVFRDPRSLGMGIAIPLLLLFLFGYALTLDVDRVPLVVWDRSGTDASRELVGRFSGSRYFLLRGYADNYRDLESAIDRREAMIAVVIPGDFARGVGSGREASVQAILDGSDPNNAAFALAYAEGVVAGYSRDVTIRQALHRTGRQLSAGQVEARPRVWFNTDLVSRNYLFPGLIAIIMMIIAALLTSLTVVREWETGTMEQLISTPLQGGELILGKLIPYFAIGVLDLVLSVLVGQFLFQVPLRGSLWLLFAMSVIFLVSALSLGMLISIVARSQLLASQVALVATMLPAFLLSGLIFPIDNMPPPIQAVTCLVTARYFVSILRGIYLKGVGLEVMAWEAGILVLFSVLAIALSIVKFRKRIG